ncbi:hypothetical protein NC653_031075 [Populus alba x Populus x berolinensis]|uniref:Uncharacterized protein n=3 Tax=Populus TaxID=3689 RepID=A0A4U5MZ22_POPAL|nr:hypothetical protein NC653_031075 [Populus alba x Populus x berolinensis]TKR74672.1 hypothetical protein D5086_0000292780 [Populus alba]
MALDFFFHAIRSPLSSKAVSLLLSTLEALAESFSNQIEGLSGDAFLHLIETLEKKLMGLRGEIGDLLSIRGGRGQASAHGNDNSDHALVPCDCAVPEPIDANNCIFMVENMFANPIVDEDLAEYFWDSELLKLAGFECQPITPEQ